MFRMTATSSKHSRPEQPHAVIMGLSPTGLYVARELGRLSIPLLGIDKDFGCGFLSRYFHGAAGTWKITETDTLLEKLLTFAAGLAHKPVLIPTNDFFIAFVIAHNAALSAAFSMAPCYTATAQLLLDKSRFHALCVRHGMQTPATWLLSSMADIDSIIDAVPVPCLLKPTFIHQAKYYMQGSKAFVVHSHEELREHGARIPPETGSWLVQEIIPGQESNITLLAGYASHNPAAQDSFTARKLRQFPPGLGSASRAISACCTDTTEQALQFIEQIGFEGIYGAEFKRDPRDGQLKIIEINPRPTLWFQLSNTSGKQLSAMAYYDLAGIPVPARAPQENGVVWIYALKDFASALYYRTTKRHDIFPPPDIHAAGSLIRRSWAIFAFHDPLPLVGELYVYLKKGIGRVI